jgi:hypothetical protein
VSQLLSLRVPTCPVGPLRYATVLAQYAHPFEYLWLRRNNPSGLLELNQPIVARMAFFGQDRVCVRPGLRP